MSELSRRSVVLMACGSAASLAAVAVWNERRGGTLTRGRGAWTSFGSVAVLGSRREAFVVTGHGGHAGDTRHGGHAGGTDLVRVEVEVHNGRAAPLLFSAGQFRLRFGARGVTVTPFDVGEPPAAVAGRSTRRTWVSYLVPREVRDWQVEFTEAGPSRVVAVPAASAVNPGPEHRHGVSS